MYRIPLPYLCMTLIRSCDYYDGLLHHVPSRTITAMEHKSNIQDHDLRRSVCPIPNCRIPGCTPFGIRYGSPTSLSTHTHPSERCRPQSRPDDIIKSSVPSHNSRSLSFILSKKPRRPCVSI